MVQKNKLILCGVAALGLIGAAFFYWKSYEAVPVIVADRIRKEIYDFDTEVCPGKTIVLKMSDPYLRGLIDEGADVPAVINAFKCETIATDDIALYRFSEFDEPVFRRVVGVPGDYFEVAVNKDVGGWELSINGKKIRGTEGEPYIFGGELPPPLSLASHQQNGKLIEGQAIVLSAFPPGDRDSGVFGVIAISDLIAKVQKNAVKPKTDGP